MVYVKKAKIVHLSGPDEEWVVRIKGENGSDMAICGCPGKWEADFVKQCVIEALGQRNPCVRMKRLLSEIGRTVGKVKP